MEAGDFIWYTLIVISLFVPLAWNYFILYTLNWNERKNLLSDSWMIFITWFVSSLVVLLFFLIVFIYSSSELFGPVLFFSLLICVNIFSIVAVLSNRTKAELSINDALSKSSNAKIGIDKIWQTAVIVTFLNYVMITSLFMFMNDISKRLSKESEPPSNSDSISF